MGISNLAKLLAERAPSAIKENEMKLYFGRKVAIDASMSIYQFLIAVRQDGNVLTNEAGEVTSHLMGTFYRTIRMIESGLKPIYVFDGKPPEMKSKELSKRTERREEAEAALKKAEEEGNVEEINKFNRRLVKVTKEHNEECKKLLNLMGVPVVSAPCEAEAQCAEIVKAGKAYAIGTEDMDGLTFGSTFLLRHLTASESRKLPIREYSYNKILEELQLNKEEFIDLCILMGCDYCESIKGIGPKKALDLITQYRCIEKIVENIDKSKYPLPENWLYQEARRLFVTPDVTPGDQLDIKFPDVDEEGLVQFMVNEKGFSEDRIRNGAKKLLKAKQGTQQGRLDSFFKAAPSPLQNSKKAKNEKIDSKSALKKVKSGGVTKKTPKKR